ncbi:uncharacterized protein [Bemisia tabaci]
MAWKVVIFTDENKVREVPVGWVNEEVKTCVWPSIRTESKVTKYIEECRPPSEKWRCFNVRILAKGKIFSTHQEAKLAALLAEDLTDIESEAETTFSQDSQQKQTTEQNSQEKDDSSGSSCKDKDADSHKDSCEDKELQEGEPSLKKTKIQRVSNPTIEDIYSMLQYFLSPLY